jgi:hypothetical protein
MLQSFPHYTVLPKSLTVTVISKTGIQKIYMERKEIQRKEGESKCGSNHAAGRNPV